MRLVKSLLDENGCDSSAAIPHIVVGKLIREPSKLHGAF